MYFVLVYFLSYRKKEVKVIVMGLLKESAILHVAKNVECLYQWTC